MMIRCRSASAVLLAAGLALTAAGSAAQETPDGLTPPGEWVLGTTLGAGTAQGDYGSFLEKPINFDLNIGRGRGAWRFGGGLQFGSMDLQPPYEDQEEFGHLETYFFATRVFNHTGKVRPYLQARLGIERLHPRSEVFYFDEPENLESGASPTKPANGLGLTLQPGFELQLTQGLALDVSGWWRAYRTGDYDLEPVGGDVASSGQEYGLRAGLVWRPLSEGVPELPKPFTDPSSGELARLPTATEHRNAWGVPRSWGWATVEMFGINFGASMFNEYVRNANFNQISPRSHYENFKTGWTFDDNKFRTNQLIHPFNGATYFNAARANGVGFWGSSLMSLAGAFVWECCGETHPMSWNDMISTGIGGIARGEWAYRLSSLILDNSKSGGGRTWREIGAFPLNPIRGLNRLLSGRASRVQGNPENPYDRRPPNLGLQLHVGARVIGEGQSISENTNYYGFAEASLQFASPFKSERRKPYDRFDTSMQLNFGDKTAVGRLQIRGDLFSWPLGNEDQPKHVVAISQDFDYVDNEAYEYGGQSYGVSLFSGFGRDTGTHLVTRVTGYMSPMSAVNSDYSFLAEVANRERFREYDYGPGVGAGVEGLVSRNGRAVFSFSYRYTWIDVRNGSIYNPDDGGEGSSAKHQVHRARLRLMVPVGETLGIGADAALFYRDSRYDLPELEDKTQRNPQVRLFLTWDLGYTRRPTDRAAGDGEE